MSLRSGSRLSKALRRRGPEVSRRGADGELVGWLTGHRPDAAIIVLHGKRGENGAIQRILEMAAVPYVGTATTNCRPAYEKSIARNLMRRAGFPAPDWVSLRHSTSRDHGARTLMRLIIDHLDLPPMVKPQHGGSALGANSVRDPADLPAALVGAFAYGTVTFLEVNVSPGLTETSLRPMAVAAAGLELGAVYAELVGRAIERGG